MFGTPVRTLHLEITSRCTLACPRCARTIGSGTRPAEDVPVELIVASVNRRALPSLQSVLLCGNYGDPIYHRAFHEVLRHLKAEDLAVTMETNGSFRSATWWRETAGLFGPKDKVTFSIDGLEDTNGVYRVNSRWSDIMAAVAEMQASKAFLQWKFIVFRYNEHQIDEAMTLAATLGFDEFKLVRSDRFGERWKGSDGVDPLMPSPDWLSGRLVSTRLEGRNHGG